VEPPAAALDAEPVPEPEPLEEPVPLDVEA
jgi:hypothetical protein